MEIQIKRLICNVCKALLPFYESGDHAECPKCLTTQLAERDRELEGLKAAFEPVEDWYNAEGAPTPPTFVNMLETAVSDLQEDRQALLASDQGDTRLREDGERLDWLETAKPIMQHHGADCCGWYLYWDDEEATGDTTRQAIDAARGEGE